MAKIFKMKYGEPANSFSQYTIWCTRTKGWVPTLPGGREYFHGSRQEARDHAAELNKRSAASKLFKDKWVARPVLVTLAW